MRAKKKVLLVTVLMVVAFTTSALAIGYERYALYANQVNNYTYSHEKQYNDLYLTNKVDDLSNTDLATFWATNSDKNQISGDYMMGEGSTANINWLSGFGYMNQGTSVRMGMENYHWDFGAAYASGDVDFR